MPKPAPRSPASTPENMKTFTTYRMIYETALYGVCSNIINGVRTENALASLRRFLSDRGDELIRVIQIDEIA